MLKQIENLGLKLPDYDNSIVNLSASILKRFGVFTDKKTLPILDKVLDKNYKNVVLLVCDGMGSYNLEKLVDNDNILRISKISDVSSVYPSTTVAALTSIESALQPCEHCCIGWTMYIEKINKVIATFTKKDESDGQIISDNNLDDELKYSTIFNLLKAKKVKYCRLSPFSNNYFDRCLTLEDYSKRIVKNSKKMGHKFIYAYYNRPDFDMHDFGAFSSQAKHAVEEISQTINKLKEKLHDTVLIVTCDHGQTDRTEKLISDNILDCCQFKPSVEPTALAFKIKEGRHAEFKELIKKEMPDVLLFTAQEFADLKLLGTAKNSPKLLSRLCDYFAVAIGNNFYTTELAVLKALMQGLLKKR